MYQYLGSTDILMYDIFTIYMSSLALLIYNLMHIKEKRELLSGISQIALRRATKCRSRIRYHAENYWAIIEIILISLYQHGLVSMLNKMTGNLLNTGANYFGLIFFMPLLLPLLCWMIGIDPFKQIDLITPAYPVALFFMKIGCFCAGCCRGISSTFGMYNRAYDCVEIPVQLIEAAFAVMIFFVLLIQKKKSSTGTLLPQYMILYCGSRFFSEFFRQDPNVFLGLKLYHILCIVGFSLGMIQLLLIKKYRGWIEKIFDNNLPTIIMRKGKNKLMNSINQE